MTRKQFISKILKSKRNTVFVNKEQVAAVLDLFERFGMKAPATSKHSSALNYVYIYPFFNQWDEDIEKDVAIQRYYKEKK